jgi:hypothetical protein
MSPRFIGVIIHIIFGEVRVSNGSAEKKSKGHVDLNTGFVPTQTR